MAQNYEIDIKRFNGQDYDTLLPTPASHASTHQADGSDPITLQSGNYGASSIPTSAYQNTSVTRVKLAQDTLYSPMAQKTDNYAITIADIGMTIRPAWNTNISFNLTQENSAALPIGAEIAIFSFGYNNEVTLSASGLYLLITGASGRGTLNTTVKISESFGMIALKKVSNDSSGNAWLVTGNVEVV